MSVVVVVGAQWGDEGKGKVIDLLCERAGMVVRYAGGPNAGHTLVVGDSKVVVRLIPSGILHPHTQCLLGQGMVVDPWVFLSEVDVLEARGDDLAGRLWISESVHLVLPHHLVLDAHREADLGDRKIGTTKKGIGPAYEDKVARRGIRLADLRDPARLARLLEAAHAPHQGVPDLPSTESVLERLLPIRERLLSYATDASLALDRAVKAKMNILLEGAQGTLLDIDHGTYPFVTSSSAVAGGASTGAGIGPSRIQRVMGITKAYATRVGSGPFPSELTDAVGDRIRERGHEFGSVTGRPRRVGWLDLPALRYAARVNGLDTLALTKLDVLSGLESISVCTGYRLDGEIHREFPLHDLDRATPIFEKLPGFSEPLERARSVEELPSGASQLISRIEAEIEIPIELISVGPRRDQTILLREPF